jgi:hypothetical protein
MYDYLILILKLNSIYHKKMYNYYLNQKNIYLSHVFIQGLVCILFIIFPDTLILANENKKLIIFFMRSIGITLLSLTLIIYKIRNISIRTDIGKSVAYCFLIYSYSISPEIYF